LSERSPDGVFLNCPFDEGYDQLFNAIVFAIYACGFRARCALEMDDASETRISKIYDLIEQCRYGIHDLSRTEIDAKTRLPRFNMPFELGIFLGAKRFGSEEQRRKRCLVLDSDDRRYEKFISDLKGSDIQGHGGDAEQAVARVRDWLANVSRRKLPGGARIWAAYEVFVGKLPPLAQALELEIDRLTYADYEGLVVSWLEGATGEREV